MKENPLNPINPTIENLSGLEWTELPSESLKDPGTGLLKGDVHE